ncbi:uncharacterized protein LOC111894390 [Lactuca sativa]|uniref:uncharacterized protein LOC111894390 n=1 Tax=Lactuca sativa TaxID=4236 RepID=UPI000CD83D27|nr:uncharacterized protein LOC111894390 [Lactuca sativa]
MEGLNVGLEEVVRHRIIRGAVIGDGDLNLNLNKSYFYRIRLPFHCVEEMVGITGYDPACIPFSYLGLPFGANMNRGVNWNPVIQSETKREIPWVKRNLVLNFKEKGGLRIGSLKTFNLALRIKWRLCFYKEVDVLWAKVIQNIDGMHDGLGLSSPKLRGGVWSNLVKAFDNWDLL